jgi:multiple sugar transport system substrate-binding protein
MNKRKVLSTVALLSAFLVCGVLAFAGGQQGEGGGAGAAGPTTVIFYLWDDPAYSPIIEAFNSSQSDIYVDARFIPTNEYEAKISTLLAGGAEMDGYMQKRSTDIFTHYANGYIAPLSDLCAKTGFDLDAISGYKSAVTIDGEIVAIPFRGASYFTYYNKKLFEEAGVPTPENNVQADQWTWNDFIDVARQIKAGVPDVYGGFLYTWGSNNVIPALQNGVPFIDADGNVKINQSVINSYKYRREMEAEGLIMPLTETKITKTHYSKPFYEGEVAMLIIGEWFPGFMIKGRDENLLEGYTWNDWSLTRIPCDEPEYRTFGNPTFSHVHAASKKKEAMFDFISWMGGPEGAKIVAASGLLPAYITEDVKAEFASILPDQNAINYFTEPRVVNTQFYNKYGSKVESELAAIMEEYLANPVSDAELRSTIEKRLQMVAEQIQ